MKMKIYLKTSLFIYILLLANGLHAQSGTFISLWGGPQLTRMPNNNDYYLSVNAGYSITPEETFRSGFGFDYINNFQNTFGWQTGLTYSREGQVYSADSVGKDKAFTSGIEMNYIKIPIAYRFNSQFDEGDVLNISIYIGGEFSYLTNVSSVWSNPPDTIPAKYRGFNFINLYNRLNFGMVAGTELNWHVKSNKWAYIGVRYDRSFTNIEKNDYNFPADFPSSWFFPVSTLKVNKPADADMLARPATLPGVVNVHVGIMIQIKPGKPPVPIEDNDKPATIDENAQ